MVFCCNAKSVPATHTHLAKEFKWRGGGKSYSQVQNCVGSETNLCAEGIMGLDQSWEQTAMKLLRPGAVYLDY